MRNFHQLCRGVNVLPLAHQLARQEYLWNQHTLRSQYPGSPHSEISDIWLRFQDLSKLEEQQERDRQAASRRAANPDLHDDGYGLLGRLVLDEHESIPYPAWQALPAARPLVLDLLRLVEGERLGRVLITRLAPGKRIALHRDGGDHAAYYDRYHLAIQVLPGVVFRCGDESPPMATGDIWWFDNSLEHEVINNSSDDRLTMIVDIRTGR